METQPTRLEFYRYAATYARSGEPYEIWDPFSSAGARIAFELETGFAALIISTAVEEWPELAKLALDNGVKGSNIRVIAGNDDLEKIAQDRAMAQELGVVFFTYTEISGSIHDHRKLFSGV